MGGVAIPLPFLYFSLKIMAILPQVDRNELIKHNKCIFVNVPFSDDQQRQLLKCKSETEKAELVR
ncbi:MAG: hypothetical protein LBG59_07550 [Candidatus Peribacteria bacterium]|nr:hypothetical protein [Candidatus Peribacteria bacterium]